MVTVLHALEEKSQEERDLHIQFWHGTIHPRDSHDEDNINPVVCWCGGRRYDMSEDVCVVWHKAAFAVVEMDWDDDE
jgi:hypothetical protein